MRKIVAISALSVLAAGSVAAGAHLLSAPADTMTADLERDLSLATSVQSTRTGVVSAIEQGRNAAPSGTAQGARMVVPTKKKAPAPAAAQTIADVALAPADRSPEPATIAPPDVTAPAGTAATVAETAVSAPAPEPTATVVTASGGPSAGTSTEGEHNTGNSGAGTDGNRGGTRGRMGGIVGVILRGGAAGDDNCEPPGRGRNGHPTGGVIGAIGGILAGGGGMPAGSLPGGNRGRRW